MNAPEIGPSQANASSHRLSAVTALDALDDLESGGPANIPTGLSALDEILCPNAADPSGFERGKIHEIWGPSGAGKTALLLKATANTLRAAGGIVWMGLHAPTFPAPATHLLVIDGLSGLVDVDYPRFQAGGAPRTEPQKYLAGRRWAVLGALVDALGKLAVSRNLAVLVTTGCASRVRPDSGLGSALVPGIAGTDWDDGIWSRLVVFRDYQARFVGVLKCQGSSLVSRESLGEVGRLVPFEIGSDGQLRQITEPQSEMQAPQVVLKSPSKPRKRFFDEVADSEEEEDDYGWLDLDEQAIAMRELSNSTVSGATGNATEPIDVG